VPARRPAVSQLSHPAVYLCAGASNPEVNEATSQIDLAPTLLGLLNMDYISTFFGRNNARTVAQARAAG
jgi:phosphoglycerol transferase MdoB-like AlkP superfamily enzyme